MDRIVRHLNLACLTCPKAIWPARRQFLLTRKQFVPPRGVSISRAHGPFIHLHLNELYCEARQALFLAVLFRARLNIALFGNITCGTKYIEDACPEAQKEEYDQSPGRRTGDTIDEPAQNRTDHDPAMNSLEIFMACATELAVSDRSSSEAGCLRTPFWPVRPPDGSNADPAPRNRVRSSHP